MSSDSQVDVVETPEAEPTAYTKAEQSHYQAIRENARDVAALESDYVGKKESATAAKKRFEAADAQLRALIERGPDLQQRLPGMGDADGSNQEWRDLPLADLELPAALAEKLAEAELATLGELSEYMNEHGDQWWSGIDGIGETKGAEVAEKFMAFWEAHPEYCGGSDAIRINIKAARDVKNGAGDILLAAGETISVLTDEEGVPYLIDPSDDDPLYLMAEDWGPAE